MSAMNELSQTVEELRTAAQALISAADSLTHYDDLALAAQALGEAKEDTDA